MNNIKWVVEDSIFDENSDNIAKYANVARVKYRPFDNEFIMELISGEIPYYADQRVIFYGSIDLGQKLIQQSYSWQVWLPNDVFDCTYWMPRLLDECYNKDAVFVPFGSLFHHLHTDDKYNNVDDVFIRPNSGYKLFTGHQMNISGSIHREVSLLKNQHYLHPEDLVLINHCGTPDYEYRLIVGNSYKQDKTYIIGGSLYKEYGYQKEDLLHADHPVFEYANKILDKCEESCYFPAPVWTLDICGNDKLNKFHVLETGSFTSAGLYANNIQNTVQHVEKLVLEYLE